MCLDLTKQRLESAVRRVETFIDQNLSTWGTEEVLLPAQTDLANSISEKAARALSIDKSGWMKLDLVWDLRGVNNEPLHFYLEFGTDAHKIRPKGKEYGGANVLHWKGPSGGFVIGGDNFAMEVNHPGSKKHDGIIEVIKNERMPDLQKRITEETNNRTDVDRDE